MEINPMKKLIMRIFQLDGKDILKCQLLENIFLLLYQMTVTPYTSMTNKF